MVARQLGDIVRVQNAVNRNLPQPPLDLPHQPRAGKRFQIADKHHGVRPPSHAQNFHRKIRCLQTAPQLGEVEHGNLVKALARSLLHRFVLRLADAPRPEALGIDDQCRPRAADQENAVPVKHGAQQITHPVAGLDVRRVQHGFAQPQGRVPRRLPRCQQGADDSLVYRFPADHSVQIQQRATHPRRRPDLALPKGPVQPEQLTEYPEIRVKISGQLSSVLHRTSRHFLIPLPFVLSCRKPDILCTQSKALRSFQEQKQFLF